MEAYEEWFEDVSSTRPDNYAKPAIHIGTAKETHTVLTPQDWTRLIGNGWGDKGFWKLEVVTPAIFDIVVRLPEAQTGATAQMDLNGQKLVKQFEQDQASLKFEGIALDAGSVQLIGQVLDEEGDPVKLFHVELYRK